MVRKILVGYLDADRGVDLLVLGSRPGGPVRRRLHRSVSNPVLATSRCPVLLVPAAVAAGAASPA